MKILTLWHDLPSPYTGDSLPIFNLFKYLSQSHNITLISFKQLIDETRYNYDLSPYYESIKTVNITEPKTKLQRSLSILKNASSQIKLFSEKPVYLDYYSSSRIKSMVDDLLNENNFDLVYTSVFMAFYVQYVNLPKVVHEFDCVTEAFRQKYISTKNPLERFFCWLEYIRMKKYERNITDRFDTVINVSSQEQQNVKKLFPNANSVVIPNGVDSEFFSPTNEKEEFPSLVFVGNMSYQPNVDGMVYFYSQIYNNIKNAFPDIKLYIVGRNPTKSIQSLSSDKSVVVTGYVEDVRPYISRASVVITPFISGTTGIKNKVLESMAMAKPVVSTSMGIDGITLVTDEHVTIANDPGEFAKCVIALLNDKPSREKIGNSARNFVESNYSWKTMAAQLDNVLLKTIETKGT